MRKGKQQTGWARGVVIALAACLLVLAGLLVSLTVFLNGQGLRERIETALSHSLGRSVRIDSLQFSLATGSAVAHGLRIAEDPRFGTNPFVQAADVRLGLALWPLLSRRMVQIGSIELRRPQIRLLRDSAGIWNYSSFGSHSSAVGKSAVDRSAAALPTHRRADATLTVSRIEVKDGQVLVRVTAAGGAPEDRLYDGLDVQVTHFDLHRPFPFRVAARLPAGGAVEVTGFAGPSGREQASAMPVTAHVAVTHLDLAAAGLVRTASRVTGLLPNASADVSFGRDGLHVQSVTAENPVLHVGAAASTAPGSPHPSVWRQLLQQLQVDRATVHGGTVTFDRQDGSHVTARGCDMTITHWASAAPADVTITAGVAGGSVRAAGTFSVQPQETTTSRLRTNLQLKLRGIDLPGVLPSGSPLRGAADADLHLVDNGDGWVIDGLARVNRLVLARNGQPAPGAMLANFRVEQSPSSNGVSAGTVQRGELSFGGASLRVSGAYWLGGPATILNLNVAAQHAPIDSIESWLPAAGIQLPENSRLSGGNVTIALSVRGTPANLTVDGPVHIEGTRLDGFDLGGKLASLARFTGGRLGSTGSSGTVIRSIGFHLHTGEGQTSTDDLAADVAGVGKISGHGSISQGAALHYNLLLRLEEVMKGAGGGANVARGIASGLPAAWAARALSVINTLANGAMRNGIPLLVGGTAKHPTITPDLGALIPAQQPPVAPTRSPWPAPQNSWPGTQK